MTAAPWLLLPVSTAEKEWEEGGTYEYPPAVTMVFGHFEFANRNRRVASPMAAGEVPRGRVLAERLARYGKPTPWQAN